MAFANNEVAVGCIIADPAQLQNSQTEYKKNKGMQNSHS